MRVLALILALIAGGCVETRYVVQAGLGQLDLWSRARSIQDVLADKGTDARTRYLLELSVRARVFAGERGLASHGNYRTYVDLERSQVVWFLAASRPLELSPVTWNFPIVGSFPYLGWFSETEARKIAGRLRADGYDVFMRRVHAYSTGGYFRDPVLSTMLLGEDTAHLSLVNTLIHELVHANVFIADQSIFNESIASFIGDAMAGEFLIAEYGQDSVDVQVYRLSLEEDKARVQRLTAAYRELEALYASDLTEAEKRKNKREITRGVRAELDLSLVPNNASLLGFKTYNSGLPELAALKEKCQTWPKFFAAIESLDARSFPREQEEDIGPVITRLAAAACP